MVVQVIIFVVLTATGFLAINIKDCPPDLSRQSLRAHGQSCYLFDVDYVRQFHTAQETCKTRGGHLAIIRDMDTQNFLYLTMRNEFGLKDGPVWIGLTDSSMEGHYVWVDGSPATFTYWDLGQPGFAHIMENCVAMDMSHGGKWGDYICRDFIWHHRHPYVCEYSAVIKTTPSSTTFNMTTTTKPTTPEPTTPKPTTPEPTTPKPTTPESTNSKSTTPGTTTPTSQGHSTVTVKDCPSSLTGQGLKARDQSCYVFYTNSVVQFDTAERNCQQQGGHLVIIRDLDTQNFLYNTMRYEFGFNGVVWIGLSDTEKNGRYKWVDGSFPSFTYWSPGQPSGTHWFEVCVAMNVSDYGRWGDNLCHHVSSVSHQHAYVCEYPIVNRTQYPNTTPEPSTPKLTTPEPTTPKPTTPEPSTPKLTTPEPTTPKPTTPEPTTPEPTTPKPTTPKPTTPKPTTPEPTTPKPTTPELSTSEPTTLEPSTPKSKGCPVFGCPTDCGLTGYKKDHNNCLLCECDE